MFAPEVSDTKRTTDATRSTDGGLGFLDAFSNAGIETLNSLENTLAGGKSVFSQVQISKETDSMKFKAMDYSKFQLASCTNDTNGSSRQSDDFISFLEKASV